MVLVQMDHSQLLHLGVTVALLITIQSSRGFIRPTSASTNVKWLRRYPWRNRDQLLLNKTSNQMLTKAFLQTSVAAAGEPVKINNIEELKHGLPILNVQKLHFRTRLKEIHLDLVILRCAVGEMFSFDEDISKLKGGNFRSNLINLATYSILHLK